MVVIPCPIPSVVRGKKGTKGRGRKVVERPKKTAEDLDAEMAVR